MSPVEKRRPTYDLDAIKAAFNRPNKLKSTVTALRTARALGFTASDMVATIQSMSRSHFYKSMPSHGNHRVWQDVYHVPHTADLVLYVKFTADHIAEFRLLSFKRKDD